MKVEKLSFIKRLKHLILRIYLFRLERPLTRRTEGRRYKQWIEGEMVGAPPEIVKQVIVREYATRFRTSVFIETGTYLGDMVDAVKGIFRQIYSVELSELFYKKAKKRFAKYKHIQIIHGDSSSVLPVILRQIEEPCLFWLDAHFSGGITAKGELVSPVFDEVECILGHSVAGHVILIDDAREFGRELGYPTIKQLRELVIRREEVWEVDVRCDIIRIHKTE